MENDVDEANMEIPSKVVVPQLYLADNTADNAHLSHPADVLAQVVDSFYAFVMLYCLTCLAADTIQTVDPRTAQEHQQAHLDAMVTQAKQRTTLTDNQTSAPLGLTLHLAGVRTPHPRPTSCYLGGPKHLERPRACSSALMRLHLKYALWPHLSNWVADNIWALRALKWDLKRHSFTLRTQRARQRLHRRRAAAALSAPACPSGVSAAGVPQRRIHRRRATQPACHSGVSTAGVPQRRLHRRRAPAAPPPPACHSGVSTAGVPQRRLHRRRA